MKSSWKNIGNWRSWKLRIFESAILIFFFKKKIALSQWKQATRSYEISFISAISMVSSGSWKRLHPNCIYLPNYKLSYNLTFLYTFLGSSKLGWTSLIFSAWFLTFCHWLFLLWKVQGKIPIYLFIFEEKNL